MKANFVSSRRSRICHAGRWLSADSCYAMTVPCEGVNLRGLVPVALGRGTKQQPVTPQTPDLPVRAREDREVGIALRAAYQSALDEDIPPEMLDLLSKLK